MACHADVEARDGLARAEPNRACQIKVATSTRRVEREAGITTGSTPASRLSRPSTLPHLRCIVVSELITPLHVQSQMFHTAVKLTITLREIPLA